MVLEKNGYPYPQEGNWILTLHHTQKNNSKWTKHLNVRPLTVKLLEENVEEKVHDIDLGNDFMNMTPKR